MASHQMTNFNYYILLYLVLAVAQILAIMPVSGLRQKKPRFKWFTLTVIFSLWYIIIVYILAFLQGRQTFNGKVNTSSSGNFNSILTNKTK